MSAKQTFSFPGYSMRPANVGNPHDRTAAIHWTKNDPDHQDVNWQFWLEQKPGRDSYVMEDAEGVLLFFKMHHLHITDAPIPGITSPTHLAAELHIQFGPQRRLRNARGLTEGMAWLENALSLSGIRELVFTSTKPALIEFCTRRLGFEHQDGLLRKQLSGKDSHVRSDDSTE